MKSSAKMNRQKVTQFIEGKIFLFQKRLECFRFFNCSNCSSSRFRNTGCIKIIAIVVNTMSEVQQKTSAAGVEKIGSLIHDECDPCIGESCDPNTAESSGFEAI
jgi:hypothetical protein